MVEQLNKIFRTLRLLVNRVVTTNINTKSPRQKIEVVTLGGEVLTEVELFEQYGITSSPSVNSEAILLSVGGKRQHVIAIAANDKTVRPATSELDVIVYHAEGHNIKLTTGGNIEINAAKLVINCDVEINGVSKANNHVSDGISGVSHTHPTPRGESGPPSQ